MGPGGPMQMMRSFARDPSVTDTKLAPGTARRIAAFAEPYRRELIIFLALTVLGTVSVGAMPFLIKALIDQGIGEDPPESGRPGLVLALALVMVGLAFYDAV